MKKLRTAFVYTYKHWNRLTVLSRILYGGAALLLAATVVLVLHEGAQVYYLAFHRPFSFSLRQTHRVADTVRLPVFQVSTTLSASQLHAGDTLHMTAAVSTTSDTMGFFEIWLRSPNNKEVFKSPASEEDMDPLHPQHFQANKLQTLTFDYTFPQHATPGVYSVSEIITSPNQQTDYYVHEKFATVTIQ